LAVSTGVPAHVGVKTVGTDASTSLPASDRRKAGLERYQTSGFPLTSAGRVRLNVTLLREGFTPVEHAFTVRTGTSAP